VTYFFSRTAISGFWVLVCWQAALFRIPSIPDRYQIHLASQHLSQQAIAHSIIGGLPRAWRLDLWWWAGMGWQGGRDGTAVSLHLFMLLSVWNGKIVRTYHGLNGSCRIPYVCLLKLPTLSASLFFGDLSPVVFTGEGPFAFLLRGVRLWSRRLGELEHSPASCTLPTVLRIQTGEGEGEVESKRSARKEQESQRQEQKRSTSLWTAHSAGNMLIAG
jgi:hypothetical protein